MMVATRITLTASLAINIKFGHKDGSGLMFIYVMMIIDKHINKKFKSDLSILNLLPFQKKGSEIKNIHILST